MARDVGSPQFPGIEARILWCRSVKGQSADCAMFCRCDDGQDYAVKKGDPLPTVPHSEWFCTRLGELVGIAAPVCRIVDDGLGKWFGSRLEVGHENPIPWWIRATTGSLNIDDMASTLSRIYAFDLFVNNVDRHGNNYIVREQALGASVLAFDYSRAWLSNGFPPPQPPMATSTNTRVTIRTLAASFGQWFSQSEAAGVLGRIAGFTTDQAAGLIDEHPSNWLTADQKNAILAWWFSQERQDRIDQIFVGIGDGTFL